MKPVKVGERPGCHATAPTPSQARPTGTGRCRERTAGALVDQAVAKARSRPRTMPGIGGESRSGTKIPRRKACRFDSGLGHTPRPVRGDGSANAMRARSRDIGYALIRPPTFRQSACCREDRAACASSSQLCPTDDFARHLPTWRQAVASGRRTARIPAPASKATTKATPIGPQHGAHDRALHPQPAGLESYPNAPVAEIFRDCGKDETPQPIENTGGLGRNRTGVRGFAVRCMTTLPPGPGRSERGILSTLSCMSMRRAATRRRTGYRNGTGSHANWHRHPPPTVGPAQVPANCHFLACRRHRRQARAHLHL